LLGSRQLPGFRRQRELVLTRDRGPTPKRAAHQ
jgi:hypothetical protein